LKYMCMYTDACMRPMCDEETGINGPDDDLSPILNPSPSAPPKTVCDSDEPCFVEGATCTDGTTETCCGETHDSFVCDCAGSGDGTLKYMCMYTDACMRPWCETAESTPAPAIASLITTWPPKPSSAPTRAGSPPEENSPLPDPVTVPPTSAPTKASSPPARDPTSPESTTSSPTLSPTKAGSLPVEDPTLLGSVTASPTSSPAKSVSTQPTAGPTPINNVAELDVAELDGPPNGANSLMTRGMMGSFTSLVAAITFYLCVLQ